MSFKDKKYLVIKKAINKDLALFLFNYLNIKKTVVDRLLKDRYISPFETMFGTFNDGQVPGTYSHYSDIAMETLLLKVHPVMEKHTELKLQPSYSYTRMYKKGDELKRHKDRYSCEISTTLNLGGDSWPIYLSPYENVGIPDNKKFTMESKAKGIKVNLKPGDMLVYRGMELEHWREKFEGELCGQVFLHYNIDTKKNKNNIFDTRIHVGLPTEYKRG